MIIMCVVFGMSARFVGSSNAIECVKKQSPLHVKKMQVEATSSAKPTTSPLRKRRETYVGSQAPLKKALECVGVISSCWFLPACSYA